MKRASLNDTTRLRALKGEKTSKSTKSTKSTKTSSDLPEAFEAEIPENSSDVSNPKMPDNSSGGSEEILDGRVETSTPTTTPITVQSPTSIPDSTSDGQVETRAPSMAPGTVQRPVTPTDDVLDNPVETSAPSAEVASPSMAPGPTEMTEGGNGTIGTEDGQSPGSLFPSPSPSLLSSASLSIAPSEAPSTLPSSTPSMVLSSTVPSRVSTGSPGTAPPSQSNESTNSFISNPRDPTSFICVLDDNAEGQEALDDPGTLPVSFVYQLWLDNSEVTLASVLPQVERAMAEAVANSLLTCEGSSSVRRLERGVWGLSSLPVDSEIEACDSGCHRMNGELTLQTVDTTGEDDLKIFCRALNVIQDPSTLTLISMLVDGVGAIRYEESLVWCGSDVDEVQEQTSEQQKRSSKSNSSLGGGAAAGIALAGVFVLVVFMVVGRRRRREAVENVVSEVGSNKDVFSLQPTLSSPRSTVGFGGAGYTILADNQSLRDEEEMRSEPRSPTAGNITPDKKPPTEPTKVTMCDPFRLDQTDLPDRLSLQSSEGGSVNNDDDEDSQNLTQYVNPVQLAAGRRKSPKASSPPQRGLQIDSSPDSAEDVDEEESPHLTSPAYSVLSSLLGVESDGTSTDEDRSVAQIFGGGVRLLKLSDLEATHNDENDENSTSSGHKDT